MDELYSVNQKQELHVGMDNANAVRGGLYER